MDNHQKAKTLFDKLIREARQGEIVEGRTYFESSLKITGRETLLKIPADLGFDDDEDEDTYWYKEELLEFLADVKANESEEWDDFFELSIYYDTSGPEEEECYQINLSTHHSGYPSISLFSEDQTIDIIKRLLDAEVIS